MSDTLDDVPEGYRILIEQDCDVPDPRKEWDHLARLVLHHDRYSLPLEIHEDHALSVPEALTRGGPRVAMRYLKVMCDAVVLPVWGYDHGMLTIMAAGESSNPFADSWDSGMAGFAYITRSAMREAWLGEYPGDERTRELLRSEVAEYDQFLTGDVWSYRVERRDVCPHCENEEWELVTSCGGNYGREYAETEARTALTNEWEA